MTSFWFRYVNKVGMSYCSFMAKSGKNNAMAISYYLMVILAVVLAAGCVMESEPAPNCTEEGGFIPIIDNPPSCCSGLTLIRPKAWDSLGSTGICTAKCGNAVCDVEIETSYNCPADCNSTASSCKNEGESIPVIPNPPSCCSGLTLIPPAKEHVLGSAGICTAKCGNGVCDDETETSYNCPQDCNNSTVPTHAGGGGIGMANPASGNCEEKGGMLRIVTQEDGGQIGMCTLADGVTECEEWAYYRGECGAK